jgi:hypothetical protein
MQFIFKVIAGHRGYLIEKINSLAKFAISSKNFCNFLFLFRIKSLKIQISRQDVNPVNWGIFLKIA